jgi:oxygen-dependent protoporphyrinogen oxidase
MLAPTKFLPLAMSPLFSWRGKMRMAMDLFLPARKDIEDESLASFVTRRLGREAFERAAQPLVSGVYTADPIHLSLRATMPRFLEMEQKHGSVIRAMLAERRAAARARSRKEVGGSGRGDSGARYSMFVTLDEGLQILIDALASRLPADAIRLRRRVTSVTPVAPGGPERRWRISTEEGESMEADGVILSAPTHSAAKMVSAMDGELAAGLAAIAYASSVVVNVAYRQADLSRPLDGFGFVVPVVENRSIIACTFSSIKYVGRAPEGHVLLRCFAGGAIQPEVFEWDDDRLIEAIRREMRELLGIEAAPRFALVHRHPRSMPQYPVGHLGRVDRIRERLDRHPGLRLAGNAYGGVGIPDCVHSGETAAEHLAARLTTENRA